MLFLGTASAPTKSLKPRFWNQLCLSLSDLTIIFFVQAVSRSTADEFVQMCTSSMSNREYAFSKVQGAGGMGQSSCIAPCPWPMAHATCAVGSTKYPQGRAVVAWMPQPPPPSSSVSQSIWAHRTGEPGLVFAPQSTGLYLGPSMPTWERESLLIARSA